jgi:hypothetical protein
VGPITLFFGVKTATLGGHGSAGSHRWRLEERYALGWRQDQRTDDGGQNSGEKSIKHRVKGAGRDRQGLKVAVKLKLISIYNCFNRCFDFI